MVKDIEFVKINGEDIPIKIVSMKTAKHIKFYIRDNVVKITKSRYCSRTQLNRIIQENKDAIYDMYKKSTENSLEKILEKDIDILYLGNRGTISLKKVQGTKMRIYIQNNVINIELPNEITDDKALSLFKVALKKCLKRELTLILEERLDFWSKKMSLKYRGFSIKSMKSKYGSCNVKTHKLNFNISMIFMPYYVIDSIIIHELAHIKYPNHSDKFYDLVMQYSPEYKNCRKWLRDNQKFLNIL